MSQFTCKMLLILGCTMNSYQISLMIFYDKRFRHTFMMIDITPLDTVVFAMRPISLERLPRPDSAILSQ